MSSYRRIALGVLWLCCGACTEFPSIADNVCGNGVIEADNREDCDTFNPLAGSKCHEKGSANECHLDCSFDERGIQYKCYPGWGCDEDFICRAPSDHFVETAFAGDVGAWSLSAGDFDGDGRQDVMSSEPLDAAGETRLRFNYFDVQGVLADTHLFPPVVRSPSLTRTSATDATSDVAFVTEAVGFMYGNRDRSWVPEVFASYRRPNARVRSVGVYDQDLGQAGGFTTLITSVAGTGFFLGSPETGRLELRLGVSGSVEQLAGDLVSGNVFEDTKHSPCLEPVFAMKGEAHFSVVDVCDSDETGEVDWRQKFLLTEIELSPPAAIDAAPQLVDLDGDGHLDVLLGAGGKPYVSYGDGGALQVAIPYLEHADDPAFPEGTPLAVADFSGDHAVDFVYPDRLVVSRTAYVGAIPEYLNIANRKTTPWTVAKIADFNANGLLDVVAASDGSLNLDFFNGSGTENLIASVVSTSAPVQLLSAGDFDGDLITDLALFEVLLPGQTKSTMKVAFGSAFAPLPTPQIVGQVEGVEALSSFRDGGRDNLTVCSSENIQDMRNGALTLFWNGPDRVPFAPLSLTEFTSTGSVQNARAFAVASGHFVSPDQVDLLALGFFQQQVGLPPIDFWWVPAITAPGATSSRLPITLDPRLYPVALSPASESFSADVASTAANFDENAGDEAVFAMPADAGKHCGLVLIGAAPGGTFGSDLRKTVIIDEPCEDPQISAFEFDPARGADLVLLTGRSNAEDRHLYVLLNDGHGQFSAQDMRLVSADDSPQAFTVLPAQPKKAAIAYVTKHALRVVRPASARDYAAPDFLPDDVKLNNGTGIVAADVNGDHLSDLVFSEAGTLRVLKAGLIVR